MKWFRDEEFRCPCRRPECDAPIGPHRLLGIYLDEIRERWGRALIVSSGNRCADHNARVGGVDGSEHVQPGGCLGADVACWTSRDRALLLDAVRHSGITRVGVYRRHLHIGVGDAVASEKFPSPVVWVG